MGEVVGADVVVQRGRRGVLDEEERAAGRRERVVRELPVQANVPADGERASVERDVARAGGEEERPAVVRDSLRRFRRRSEPGSRERRRRTVRRGFVVPCARAKRSSGAHGRRSCTSARRARRANWSSPTAPAGRRLRPLRQRTAARPSSAVDESDHRPVYGREASGGPSDFAAGHSRISAKWTRIPHCVRIVGARWRGSGVEKPPGCAGRRPDPSRTWRRCSASTGLARTAPPISSCRTRRPRRTSPRRPFSPRSAPSTASTSGGPSAPGCTGSSSTARSTGPAPARCAPRSAATRSIERPAPAALPTDPLSEPVAQALAGLPPEHRAVIVLRHLLEYTPGRDRGPARSPARDGELAAAARARPAARRASGGGR